ncbi:MAG: hypothetical protein NC548_49585 [Lachnospiraceae bacterium]|nr:hypothetical protein [Lachnospiraceae bacterium]
MASANLANEVEQFSTGLDSILIRRMGGRIIGGCTLDLSDWTKNVVKGGHVIIKKETDGVASYKPMPVSGDAYAALPSGYEYAGVLVRTVIKSDPRAAVQYDGEINDKALPYPIDSIKAALKAAFPSLYFMHD